jgi:hypothetical protein
MTREDIIRMAQDAWVHIRGRWDEASEGVAIEELERFAAQVAAAEREACAHVCEAEARMHEHLDHNERSRHLDDAVVARTCAAAIRAQGSK